MKRDSRRNAEQIGDLGDEVMESLFAGLRGHAVDLSEDFCERVAQRTIRRPAQSTRVGPLSVVTEFVVQAMNSVTQLARLAAGASSGGEQSVSARLSSAEAGTASRRARRTHSVDR